ncbi:hypothetical protein OKW43_006593 [Paraburkholderia sp. WC7.3g]|uniref:DUF4148 domain-containing protein n=1 Tax=Paraburkholderia sp. WC7.3g TaxID=2991070 RepID=UPI003D1F149C
MNGFVAERHAAKTFSLCEQCLCCQVVELISGRWMDSDRASAAPVGADPDASHVASVNPISGETRAQVRAELMQAEEAGLYPTRRGDSPASAETIARNRAHFLRLEQAWKADGSISTAGE